MKVFLIVVAIIAILIIAILSLTAEITIIYDKEWTSKIKILFFEKDFDLVETLSFVLFPEKTASDIQEENAKEKEIKRKDNSHKNESDKVVEKKTETIESSKEKEEKPKKNYIAQIYDKDGIAGIMELFSNLIQTLNSAIITFIRGFHIYSFVLKMYIGGYDPDDTARKYGRISGIYYPIKGYILNQMKVDNYDDIFQPDFMANQSEYEFQFIAGISVGLLVKVALKAGSKFVVNLIKSK